MNTQVIFKIDKKLKEKAMKRSRSEGLPFATFLKLATKAFAEGNFNVSLVSRPELNEKTKRELDQSIKNIKAGKNLSPAFTNIEDAKSYLMSL